MALTFHHLIPRKMHRRTRFARQYDKHTLNLGVYICRDCHKGVHKTYDEMELATRFNTPQSLVDCPKLRKHFAWVAKQRRARTVAGNRGAQ